MIFVTVGMHTKGFNRLLEKMDEIAGCIDEDVIIQIGHSSFRPQHAQWFDFTTEGKIEEYCRQARLVITHPAMSVIAALRQGTPVVVMPRMKIYDEVINDHQVDFARELEKQSKVVAVYDVNQLEDALRHTEANTTGITSDSILMDALKRYIAEFEDTLA